MRQCEFKKRYDPDRDMHVLKHIHGEGITDVFKAVGKKLFGKTAKSIAKTAAKSAATKVATTTGEYVAKKAGNKIVELLSKNKTKTPSVQMEPNISTPPSLSKPKELTAQEVNERVHQYSQVENLEEGILSKHIIYDKLSKPKAHRKV